jgi:hypothetical protein
MGMGGVIMLRVPVYSLALGALGMFLGAILGGETAAVELAGFGALIGYVIWLRARLLSTRAGRPFHLGSVINIVVCTVVTIGASLGAIAGPDGVSSGLLWGTTLSITAVAIWLHWHFAKQVRILPPAREVGKEVLGVLFAHDIGIAAGHAILEVGKDMTEEFRRKKT